MSPSEKEDPTVAPPLPGTLGRRNQLTQQLDQENFSLAQAMGGKAGLAEAVIPTVLFTVLYLLTDTLWWPSLCALGFSICCALVRLSRKQSLQQVLIGVIGTLISVIWAWRTGRAENFFVFGFWINGLYAFGILVSLLFRYPIIGWLVACLTGKTATWRTPAERGFYRRGRLATWAWFGLLALRLVVELPLYYWQWTTALGIARIVLGVPAFALVAYLTWLLFHRELTRSGRRSHEEPPAEETEPTGKTGPV